MANIIKEQDLRMYILVNQDVKLSKGKLAGQVGHAVNILTYYMTKNSNPMMDIYMCGEIKKVILKAPQELLEKKEKEGYISIRDKGYTQLEPNTLTCVNMGVFDYDELKNDEEDNWMLDMKLY